MPDNPVTAARALSAMILEERNETESGRRLTDAVVAGLIESGLCRLVLPADLEGLECDPLTVLEVLEELGKAEASVAWIVWNNALPCFFGRFLSERARREVFGNPTSLYASSTRPTGKAVAESDAFRVSGRWSLVSGCMHADWIPLMCFVEEDGKLQTIAPGAPQMSLAFVPRDSVEILDTWHAGGLRGTGSHDVVVNDLKVPADRVVSPLTDTSTIDGPLDRMPIVGTMAAAHASMCLGIASGAVDTLIELGRSKVTPDPGPDLRDRPTTQFTVATTAAKLAAVRTNLRQAVDSLWRSVQAGHEWSLEDLVDVWSGAHIATREARAAVSAAYEIAGSSALYTDCMLERAHRDIHAATQHVIAQPFWMEQAGRVRLGLEPTHPLFTL